MNISCAHCFTSYVVYQSISKILGRILRCSTCGHTWKYLSDLNLNSNSMNKSIKNKKRILSGNLGERQLYYASLYYAYYPLEREKRKSSGRYELERKKESTPNLAFQSSKNKKTTSISQCVFCRRSPKCNMHDLYSGRLH